jgi:branched-chain amino acid transport system permease protein
MLGLKPYQFGLIVLGVTTTSILALWRIVHSPLGLTIRAVGQNSLRAAALGHGRKRVQLISFVISAFFSGIAGTLFGMFHGNVFPDYVGVLITVDGLVMVILGGLYSFAAGIYGAIVYKILDNLIAHYFEYWQLVVGIILILVVLASPSGIAGLVERLFPGRSDAEGERHD